MSSFDYELHPLEDEVLVDLISKYMHENRSVQLQEDMKNALRRMVAGVKTLKSKEDQEDMVSVFAKAAAEQMFEYAKRLVSETNDRPRVVRVPSSEKRLDTIS